LSTRLQNIKNRQEGYQISLDQINDSIQDLLKLVSGSVTKSNSNASAIDSGTFLEQFKEQNDTMVILKDKVDLAAKKVSTELINFGIISLLLEYIDPPVDFSSTNSD
jgi:hypothetical protein